MKKNVIFLIVTCMTVVSVFAEVPQKMKRTERQEMLLSARQSVNSVLKEEKVKFEPRKEKVDQVLKMTRLDACPVNMRKPLMTVADGNIRDVRKALAADTRAGENLLALYWKPAGTMFVGVDRDAYLEGFFGGIVGAWLNGVESWVYPNYSVGAESVSYSNFLTKRNPAAAEVFKADEKGNLVDKYTPLFKMDAMYINALNMAQQIVKAGGVEDTFALASAFSDYTTIESTTGATFDIIPALTVAGAPYPYDDGMWPLTNAPIFDSHYGGGLISPIWNTKNMQYVLGTTPVTVEVAEGKDSVLNLMGFHTFYEKPQSDLYVKDITLWLSAYNIADGKIVEEKPILADNDTLKLFVFDKAQNVLMTSFATKKNLVDCSGNENSQGGSILTFPLQEKDDWGTTISEGITLNDEFSIMVVWSLSAASKFAVQTAVTPYSSALGGLTTAMIDNQGYYRTYANVEPMMMLNGVYNTFEYAFGDLSFGDGPLDTPVNELVFEEVEDGVHMAYYDSKSGNLEGFYPVVYSSFYPQDTLENKDHYVLEGPDWVEGWTYDESLWNDLENGLTDMIGFTFVAGDLPEGVAGREADVTLSCYGKSMTFHLTQGKPSGIADNKANTTKVFSTSDAFNFTYTDDFTSVEVYNINGQKVSSYTLPQTGTFSIAKSELSDGVYLFRMNGKTTEVLRAVK